VQYEQPRFWLYSPSTDAQNLWVGIAADDAEVCGMSLELSDILWVACAAIAVGRQNIVHPQYQ
jgi:hypothetical protein